MVIVAGIMMLAIAVSVVAYPFFQPSTAKLRSRGALSNEEQAELVVRRDATYGTLKELDLDHEMGKLSSDDYQVLRNRYRAQAVDILQELDSRQAEVQVARDLALEREIAARRRRQRDPAAYCSGCGHTVEPEDRFCRRCGARVRRG